MKPEEINVAKDGGPAFPHTLPTGQPFSGISLRDYFAAESIHSVDLKNTRISHGFIAQQAYALADAMLEAREGKWVETKGVGE